MSTQKRIKKTGSHNRETKNGPTVDLLHDGIVQFVKAGQFDSKIPFATIIKKINESPLSIAFMIERDAKTVVDIKPAYWDCFSGHNNADEEPITNSKQLLHTKTKLFVSNEFRDGKSVLRIEVDNAYANSIEHELSSYISRLNSSNHYGAFSEIKHHSFLFAPILKPEPDCPIGAITEFTVFENGMFCITVTVEMQEIPVDQVCEDRCSAGVSNAIMPLCCVPEHHMKWGYFDSKATYDIKELADIWLFSIGSLFHNSFDISDESHRILYMLDFDGMLDDYDQVNPPNDYEWLIFRLLHAPINEFNKRPQEQRHQLFEAARFRMTSLLEVYTSTIYRTITAVGKDRRAITKLLLEENSGDLPDETTRRTVVRNSIIGAILPAVQIEMLSAYSTEKISKSCRNIEKKSLKSLMQIRRAAYDATLQYYDSHKVKYDSLRELTDFLSSRHIRSSSENYEKIIEQFDRAIQFRENLSSSKRTRWLSFILTVFSIIGSLGQIITVLMAMRDGSVLFSPDTTKQEILQIAFIAWGCVLFVAFIGLLIICVKKRKYK